MPRKRFIAPVRFPRNTLEEIAQACPGPKWFQIYLPVDRGAAAAILGRAKAAGYPAIVLTIDTVVASNRETDRRNRFRSPLPSGNFPGQNGGYGRAPIKRDLDWDDVEFIRKTTGLPVLLKGVMTPELAVAAVEHGCAGVQVSNHGGRQLDDVSASITVLPRIADAVHGRARHPHRRRRAPRPGRLQGARARRECRRHRPAR